jgi:hypothetical protein
MAHAFVGSGDVTSVWNIRVLARQWVCCRRRHCSRSPSGYPRLSTPIGLICHQGWIGSSQIRDQMVMLCIRLLPALAVGANAISDLGHVDQPLPIAHRAVDPVETPDQQTRIVASFIVTRSFSTPGRVRPL